VLGAPIQRIHDVQPFRIVSSFSAADADLTASVI